MDMASKLNQTATWWSVTPDGYGGDKFALPTQIKCRWEERQEVFTSAVDRTEHISNAVIFADRDLAVGDYLLLGVSTLADPSALQEAFKIQRFDKIPDLRSLEAVKRAVL